MDWLAFISNVIESLAWPAAVVILVFLLRDPLTQLIPLLRKLKYKDIELEFGREVRQLRKTVTRALPKAVEDAGTLDRREQLQELAEISPRAAVLEAWVDIETAGEEAARRHSADLSERELRNWLRVFDALLSAKLIDRDKFHQLSELRLLRNLAAHGEEFDLSTQSANEYCDTALLLASYLRSL